MKGGRRRRHPLHPASTGPSRPRRLVAVAVACVAVGAAVLALFILQALEIRTLRQEMQEIHAAQQRALNEQAMLRARLAEADHLDAVEQEARARLGWVLPGEERVVFVDEGWE